MAEVFLFQLTAEVLSKISSLVLGEIGCSWNFTAEMTKLMNTLSTLKAVILDANEKQLKNHAVRDWLEKLKDAVYDIDDLLDDLPPRVSPTNTQNRDGIKKVRRFFSSSNCIVRRFKIGHRVKSLRMRLDCIAEDRKNFHFTEHENVLAAAAGSDVREPTHSFVRASDIVGRDEDKEVLVQQLLSVGDQENLSVLPVVGIGGLGKTTLVKLAYNDSRVIASFDLGIWVSVAANFRVDRIVEKILKAATGESFEHLDMDRMQGCLADVLTDKRYLLVLDDVWNEDRNKWMDLRELLLNCRRGSKVIVTTRSKTVATITGTTAPCNLSGLSDDDCLSLLMKCAVNGPDQWPPHLVTIGKEIVTKCGGVPLAVKTLGSLLYSSTDEQEWLRIRDNDIWEIDQKQSDILPILKLSYEHLPSYLKQCFAYCSIFPKCVEIPREVFINLWIAQGFIRGLTGKRTLEEIGNQYFNELLSRFCFQDVAVAFDGEVLGCKIHNLVHDLALSVAGPECLSAKSDANCISDRVRHLHFQHEDASSNDFPKTLLRFKKLRSLRYSLKIQLSGKTSIQPVALNFTRLRVLILTSVEFDELPSSISDLKRLRYLDLSHNSGIKSLPKTFSRLTNLQTLNLIKCENIQDLPVGFGSLTSLKTLYLTCQELSFRHKGNQSLSSLQFLLLYNCSFSTLPSQGFQSFATLRVLRIYDCPRLVSLPNSINCLTSLEKLWIWNCDELDLGKGEALQGLKNLQSLLLAGLPKLVSLPEGLRETALKSLKFLRVAKCASFTAFPEWLLSFTSLQRLYIEDCPNLSFLPDRIRDVIPTLRISVCPNLAGTN